MAQEKHYEMQWDCPVCMTKKLLGKTHRFCPNCGAAQNADARYFPADEDKVAVEDHELVGSDVICPACGGLNSAASNNCGTCGSPLEQGEAVNTLTKGFASGALPTQARDVDQVRHEREMAAAGIDANTMQAQQSGKKSGISPVMVGIAVVAAVVCGGIFWLFSQTEATTVTAVDHQWEREIRVEEYQTVRAEAWEDQVPAAAYGETCRLRERSTQRIQTGEQCRTERRDNGDGTFTERQVCEPTYREEPVMDDWCSYSVNLWEYERSVTTRGDGLSSAPEWGNTRFSCSSERLGCEREAGRNESYSVIFRDGDRNTYTCTFPQSEWQSISPNSQWNIEVRQFVGGAACDTLERAAG